MQAESGKAEKPAQSPRGSAEGQATTAPPTPEQPKPLGTAISCLNIFPGAKGSASDSEWETIEPSKGSSLKYPLALASPEEHRYAAAPFLHLLEILGILLPWGLTCILWLPHLLRASGDFIKLLSFTVESRVCP